MANLEISLALRGAHKLPTGARFPKWWVDCECGWFHGATTKEEARRLGRDHSCPSA